MLFSLTRSKRTFRLPQSWKPQFVPIINWTLWSTFKSAGGEGLLAKMSSWMSVAGSHWAIHLESLSKCSQMTGHLKQFFGESHTCSWLCFHKHPRAKTNTRHPPPSWLILTSRSGEKWLNPNSKPATGVVRSVRLWSPTFLFERWADHPGCLDQSEGLVNCAISRRSSVG